MFQPQKWWIGLAPLALFWGWIAYSQSEKFENGIGERLRPALAEAEKLIDKQKTSIRGRDVAIEGVAIVGTVSGAAKQAAETIAGVRLARVDLKALAVQQPYVFSVLRDGAGLILRGHVPDPATRQALLAAARTAAGAGGVVKDELQYGAGAPAAFEAQALAGVSLAGLLSSGSFSLKNSVLSIVGVARDSQAFERIRAQAVKMGEGKTPANVDVRPPSVDAYSLSIRRTVDAIVLAGLVPDPAVRSEMNRAVRAAPGVATVTDQLRYASGSPGDFADAARFATGLARQLREGEIELRGATIDLRGQAASSADFANLLASMERLPRGWAKGKVALTPPPAAPYAFNASRDGGKITLSGHVPDPALRAQLKTAAAKVAGVTSVEDRMSFASAAPRGFAQAAMQGVGIVGQLLPGRFAYSNGRVSVSGVAANSAAYEKARAAIKALPSGTILARDDVLPPASQTYVFAVERNASGIKLSGLAPSPEVRWALNVAAKKSAGDAPVHDEMAYASGAPGNFRELALYGIGLMGKLKEGAYRLDRDAASLSGEAPDSQSYSALIAAMNKLPAKGRSGIVDIRPPQAAPFAFEAHRTGRTIALSGHVSSPSVRKALVEAVGKSGFGASDNLSFASGAPGNFQSLAMLGIGAAAAVDGGQFAMSGNRFDFRADARDHAQYAQLRQIVSNFPRALRPGTVDIRPPEVRPFVWSATRESDAIRMAGFVPDEVTLAELLRRARERFPGLRIESDMKVARGPSAPNFSGAAGFALEQLERLSAGVVSLNGAALQIVGQAAPGATGADLVAVAKRKPPAGLSLGKLAISDPPGTRVRVALPPLAPVVVKRQDTSGPQATSGPPDANGAETPAALRLPRRIGVALPPAVEVVVEVPTVGQTPKTDVAVAEKRAKAAPATGSPDSETRVRTADGQPADEGKGGCAAENGAIARAIVHFPSGRTELLENPAAALTALLEKARRCTHARIELHGHADFRGDRKSNIWLSTQRTFQVKRLLTRAGVDRKRISTLGFGEDRPVAENSSFMGRARNRRVEIILR